MLCSIIKAEKFLKNYPQCKGVIYNIINNHQKMNMQAGEDKTEMLVEKYKKNYDYDTANFKNPLLPGFKHKLAERKLSRPKSFEKFAHRNE